MICLGASFWAMERDMLEARLPNRSHRASLEQMSWVAVSENRLTKMAPRPQLIDEGWCLQSRKL